MTKKKKKKPQESSINFGNQAEIHGDVFIGDKTQVVRGERGERPSQAGRSPEEKAVQGHDSENPIALSGEDFDHLVRILSGMPDFRSERSRIDFLDDVFAGTPRKGDILSLMDLSGTPRAAAVRVITRLTQFGQSEPGQETLGLVINKLLSSLGGGPDAEFLRELFER